MNKQQVLNWLFPPQPKFEAEESEELTNKRFIFMSVTGILFIVLMEILFH